MIISVNSFQVNVSFVHLLKISENQMVFVFFFREYRKAALARNTLEHVYMIPEVNSNRFEISNRFEMLFCLHGNLHGDFTAATFQTIARPYCTCANDIF